jgi:hypothetical protein
MMTSTTPRHWRGKPPGIKALGKPPKSGNPSLISQQSKQSKPITLAKVWGK